MRKIVALLIIFFAGFMTHAFLFPDLLSDPFALSKTSNLINQQLDTSSNEADSNTGNSSQAKVVFTNSSFSPGKIWITKGNHLYIRNNDKENLMNLVSQNNIFKTQRPYGFSEELDIVPDKTGNFTVFEKASNAKLNIIVKE